MTDSAAEPPPSLTDTGVAHKDAAQRESFRTGSPDPQRGPWRGPVLVILVIAVLAAAVFGGWRWWSQRSSLVDQLAAQDESLARLAKQSGALESQSVEAATRLADLSRLGDRNGRDIAALQARIDDSLALLSRISEELSGGRTRFQLAAVEQLLLLANDRLQLQRDVKSALAALDAADARLAQLSDPQLFVVREALAQERAALRAVPVVDLASAALSLASLIARVPQLPLASHAPAQFASPSARESTSPGDLASPGWRRLLQAVQATARSLFTIRREDNARAMRMLPPEAEAVVYNLLSLRLEGARVALLGGNTVAMREQLRSAADWLGAEFKSDDPGVLAARAELERLRFLELTPPLPDISRSLAALRARLQASDGARP